MKPKLFAAVDEKSRRDMWRRYVEDGRRDDGLRNYLIELETPKLQRLAAKIYATLPPSAALEEGDLLQAGAMGLIDFARRYDPQRTAFWTAGSLRALGAMRDYLRHCDHAPRLSRTRQTRREAIAHAFRHRLGREPSGEEIRRALRWTAEELADSYPRGVDSCDRTIEGDEGELHSLGQVLAACEDGPDGHLITEQFFESVCRGLDFEERVIVWLYFVRGTTMKRIGVALDLSESRVSQMMTAIKARLLARLEAVV